jgi:hypothetical protein
MARMFAPSALWTVIIDGVPKTFFARKDAVAYAFKNNQLTVWRQAPDKTTEVALTEEEIKLLTASPHGGML